MLEPIPVAYPKSQLQLPLEAEWTLDDSPVACRDQHAKKIHTFGVTNSHSTLMHVFGLWAEAGREAQTV